MNGMGLAILTDQREGDGVSICDGVDRHGEKTRKGVVLDNLLITKVR